MLGGQSQLLVGAAQGGGSTLQAEDFRFGVVCEQKNQLTHSACLFCSQNIFCNILQCLSSSIILCLWEHHRYWSTKLPCLPSWGITSSFLVVEMSGSTQFFLFAFNISNMLYVYLLFRFVFYISNILNILNALTTSLRNFFANIFFPKIVTNYKS